MVVDCVQNNSSFLHSNVVICCNKLPFARSSFNDFTAKHGKDERFKGVEKMREREQIFSDYLIELRQREKEESRTHREKVHCFILAEYETDGRQN